MRAAGWRGPMATAVLAVTAMICAPSFAAAPSAPVPARIWANDVRALQEGLVALATERLAPAGLSIDREHSWMSLSGAFPGAGEFDVQPSWDAGSPTPRLPLTFDIWPAGAVGAVDHGVPTSVADSAVAPHQTASLAVTLLRDLWVAKRRLRKGSVVTCDDLQVQRREVRNAPARSLMRSCEIPTGSVALRDMTVGDVLRDQDVGESFAVASGTPVDVTVAVGAINVTIAAVALADARAGDEIEVRLRRPARILKARVTGPSSATLMDGS